MYNPPLLSIEYDFLDHHGQVFNPRKRVGWSSCTLSQHLILCRGGRTRTSISMGPLAEIVLSDRDVESMKTRGLPPLRDGPGDYRFEQTTAPEKRDGLKMTHF